MAAWIPKSAIQVTKSHNVCAVSYAIQARDYSSKPPVIKNPTTASLKRGTGGRSSFSGLVCTVFGNSGFIGRRVCNQLGRIGSQLILPHRCDPYDVMRLKLCGDLGQVLFHEFHLNDEESIIKCVKHSNVVINLIGREYETKNFKYDDVHVEGARRLARLSKECNVEHFIHVSSLNAGPNVKVMGTDEISEVLRAKWFGELAVREEFPEATIIRPSNVYGPEDNFISLYMNNWRRHFQHIPLWEKGEKTEKQPLHVSDIAAGITAIAKDRRTAGKTYQFVGPKRYKLSDLITWMYDLTTEEAEEIGFRPVDVKYTPFYPYKIKLFEALSTAYPLGGLHWEGFKKEHVSDQVLKGLPTLEDLGINPVSMEAQMPWEIKPYQQQRFYLKSLGEQVAPPPPKTVPLQ